MYGNDKLSILEGIKITNRSFWLAIIGCLFGILLACGIMLFYIGDVLAGSGTTIGLLPVILICVFSVLGLVASLMDKAWKKLGGCLMIVAAIGIILFQISGATGITLLCNPIGGIAAIFFLLGGFLKFIELKNG